jgi:hypothetical protein
MRKRAKSRGIQFRLFQPPQRSSEVPGEVRQRIVRLLAQMLRQHVARGWAGRHVPEASND